MNETELAPTSRRRIVRPAEGRDEFNLAEFPLTLLSDRPPRGVKTLRWEDKIVDRTTGLPVTRQVIVTGSDAFGLPTASDADVLFALVQLTKLKNNFSAKDVFFSRYELLRILEWPDEGKSYKRIEDSLDRWHGTSVYFSAWRDKETETWRSEKFHILDNISLISRANRRQLLAQGQGELAVSTFSWNKVVFRNLQTGYVCPVDLDLYFSLKSAVAKRVLRYLSKHFRLRQQRELTFDLKLFAFEKVGLSRSYRDSGQIKKELQPALEELERIGFLVPMTRDERYTKLARGSWSITLVRSDKVDRSLAESEAEAIGNEEETDELLKALIARGVSPECGRSLLAASSEEAIRAHLRAFDWLGANAHDRVSKNPPGFLIESIRKDWPLPKDFLKWEEAQEKRRHQEEKHHRARLAKQRVEAEERARCEAEQARIQAYWDALSPPEQEALRARALSEASGFLVQQYRRVERERPGSDNCYLTMMVNDCILRLLDDPCPSQDT